jgi:hypothetical protein
MALTIVLGLALEWKLDLHLGMTISWNKVYRDQLDPTFQSFQPTFFGVLKTFGWDHGFSFQRPDVFLAA